MQKFIIEGGNRLSGEITLQGCKNSSLPIMAASLIPEGKCIISNCPQLTDIYSAARILNRLGSRCNFSNNTVTVDSFSADGSEIPSELMKEMRASIIFMGAMLSRMKKCKVSTPGGCNLGIRSIDMHISALRKMGVEITENGTDIICRIPSGRAKGTKITLPFPSVGATENIILCAVMAEGETIINNSAREPEICDLCGFLRACGADIKGDGESSIFIKGKEKLHGCEYRIMSDRIACATYLCMTASTGGEMIIKDACVAESEPFLSVLEQTGARIETGKDRIFLRSGARLKALKNRIRTMPHPGFPTDAQAVFMSALCTADGTSIFEENIFDNRYRHTDAFVRMGADIEVIGNKVAVVRGVKRLHGAEVEATDLRGGAGMVIAALSAEGRSEITEISHIDRGYEKIENVVSLLGGKIKRV